MDISNKAVKPAFKKILGIINRKWTILIVLAIGNTDAIRFNELRREVGNISPKTLSETLRELEDIGVIKFTKTIGPPTRIKYSLTEDGEELWVSILPYVSWITDVSGQRECPVIKNSLNLAKKREGREKSPVNKVTDKR